MSNSIKRPLVSRSTRALRGALAASLFVGSFPLLGACSSTSTPGATTSSTGGEGGMCAMPGGEVAGGADLHCTDDGGAIMTPVSEASCHPAPDDAAAPAADGGVEETAAVLYGHSGFDDDCKYTVSWTSTPVCQNTDVTFTVTVNLNDGVGATPVTGGALLPYVAVYLSDTHVEPNHRDNPTTTTEPTKGTYVIGPIRFDAPGDWTVQFHFRGDCDDGESSPHSHVAFYVHVP